MNLLEIIILAVIILFAAAGFRRGFVKKLASMLSLVLSIVLVSMFLPYITDFLKTNTPVYDYIETQCRNIVEEQIIKNVTSGSSVLSGSDSSQSSQASAYESMGREQIKALMDQNGYDSSIVDSLTDEQLEEYKQQYLQQYISQYLGGSTGDTQSGSTSEDGTQSALWQPTKIEQTELIESLPLPESIRDLMLNYNNEEGYSGLDVTNFQDYLVGFIATILLNVISFIVATLVVQLVLWIAIATLNILSHIPVIHFINRILGLLLGLLQALFFLWIFFLILSFASATDWGMNLMNMVQQSQALNYLYESNLFMKVVVSAAAMFM